MNPKKVRGYANASSPLLAFPWIALVSHWVFQSLLYMDRTERFFKLMLDLLGTAAFSFFLHFWLGWPLACAAGFLCAHTLNFLFNGHFWGIFKHYGMIHSTPQQFALYVNQLAARARREPAIERFLVFGSFSRQQWQPHSDLDARILPQPGVGNAIRACWFVLTERTRALFGRFPLDIYVVENGISSARLDASEQGIDLIQQDLSF